MVWGTVAMGLIGAGMGAMSGNAKGQQMAAQNAASVYNLSLIHI